jgi:hypothetical protein
MTYDRALGQVTAGGDNQDVRFQLVDGGRGRAAGVTWDLATGSFTLRGAQGSFAVPAQAGNVRP